MTLEDVEALASETWDMEGEGEFLFTAVIVRSGSTFQYGETKARGPVEDLRDKVQLSHVPAEEIYPLAPESLCRYSSVIDTEKLYVKRPCVIIYAQCRGSQELAQLFLDEVKVYELLSTRQHRNLARYHGCLIEDGRVIGIVLDRYVGMLYHQLWSMDRAARSRCYSDVEAGVKHLHNLGLAHNDINPRNIMMCKDGGFVVIDFDSCASDRAPLVKLGTDGWNEEFEECSSFANDHYGLRKLKEWMNL